MIKFNYWMPVSCEDEWASRSLAELVVYLTQRYRQPTHKRIEAIAAVLPDFVPSCPRRRAAYHRLASVFTSLCEAMETHVWLVDQILSPAIVRVERNRQSTNQSERDALRHMIVYSEDEHKWLRRVSGALGEAVLEISGSPVPADEALLALDLDMLVLLLNEQLDIEDRCLWPRALDLVQPDM